MKASGGVLNLNSVLPNLNKTSESPCYLRYWDFDVNQEKDFR
jgi:hypothetical protein